jgi:hypothetical protein
MFDQCWQMVLGCLDSEGSIFSQGTLCDFRGITESAEGRREARERVKVEHALASICNRKGPRARYIGLRLNEYDLNRTAMITNLHIAMNLAA